MRILLILLFSYAQLNAQSGIEFGSNSLNYNLNLFRKDSYSFANNYQFNIGYVRKTDKSMKGLRLGYRYEGLSYTNDSSFDKHFLYVIPKYNNNSNYGSLSYFNNIELYNFNKLRVYFNMNASIAYRFKYDYSRVEQIYRLSTGQLYSTQIDKQSQTESNSRVLVSTGISSLLPLSSKIQLLAASDMGATANLYLGNRTSESEYYLNGVTTLVNSTTYKVNRWYINTNRIFSLSIIYFLSN